MPETTRLTRDGFLERLDALRAAASDSPPRGPGGVRVPMRATMPRTTLRYAIEKLEPTERSHYLDRRSDV